MSPPITPKVNLVQPHVARAEFRYNGEGKVAIGGSVRDWFCLLSPWLALIGLIVWDTREKGTWRTKWKEPLALFTAILAFATVALVWVAKLQWNTLEKTDETLRAGQRAFVFLENIQMNQQPALPQGFIWYFVPNLRNNGTTQTKNLTTRLTCEFSPQPSKVGVRHSLLGPKQIEGMGACSWSAESLAQIWQSHTEILIAGDATYSDIFDDPHVYRFCRKITVASDPRVGGGILQQVTATCPDWPDCIDNECRNSANVLSQH
jgi:hypothetical protein